jgi:hypothetical protein
MTLLAIPLTDCEALPTGQLRQELGACGICERTLASVLVVDDAPSKILGDPEEGAEFVVCAMCAEIVVPVAS